MAITGQTSGTALVFDPNDVVVFSREAPNIFVDPYSNSTMNRVRFIAEERLGLGLLRATSVLKITFNGTS